MLCAAPFAYHGYDFGNALPQKHERRYEEPDRSEADGMLCEEKHRYSRQKSDADGRLSDATREIGLPSPLYCSFYRSLDSV